MNEWLPLFSGILIAVIGSGAGWAAFRRATAESAKDNAEAGRAIVGGAGDLAKLVREQMAEMHARLEASEVRITRLEVTAGLWEGWAEKALSLLDRALGMIATEHAAAFRRDVEAAKRTRPPHPRQPEEDPDDAGTAHA